jgi:hypothetical protein
VKEYIYIFHVSIYHIFWEKYRSRSSQNALQQVRWIKLPGLDPVSGSAMAAPSIRSSPAWFPSSRSEACGFTRLGQVGSPRAIPISDGNVRMPSGHSRRTTELGRVECNQIVKNTLGQVQMKQAREVLPI